MKGKQLFSIAICIAVIIAALVFWIFNDKIEYSVKTSIKGEPEETYISEENNITEEDVETVTLITIKNAESLMNILPITGFAILQERIQSFVKSYGYENITEVTIDPGSITENNQIISFKISNNANEDIIISEYDKTTNTYTFGQIVEYN